MPLFPEIKAHNHPSLDFENGSNVDNVIIYHYPCQDGITSACIAAAYLGWDRSFMWPYNYYHAAHKDGMFEEGLSPFAGRDVYIVDFSLPPHLLEQMATVANKVYVLDHHQTFRKAMAATWGDNWRDLSYLQVDVLPEENRSWQNLRRTHIKGFPEDSVVWFHDARCGSEITLHFFRSQNPLHDLSNDQAMEQFVEYIGDRDLWRWKCTHSKEFHAYLETQEMTPVMWSRMHNIMCGDREAFWFQAGTALLAAQKNRVQRVAARSWLMNIQGHEVPVVNATNDVSEIGYELLQLYPDAAFSATYQDLKGGVRKFSLRGRKEDDFDVSAIAKALGGGGHPKACGFELHIGHVTEI
jgi:oligoribonuclease NrnB/cAMP/cGMP phosphodiesterase (DHH superfamily)